MWGTVLNYIGTYVSNLQIVVIFGPSVWIVLLKMLISLMAFWFLYRLLLWWYLYHVLIIVIISMWHLILNWAVIHIFCDGTPQLCAFVLLYRVQKSQVIVLGIRCLYGKRVCLGDSSVALMYLSCKFQYLRQK